MSYETTIDDIKCVAHLLIASKLYFESHSLTNDKLLLNNGTIYTHWWREVSSVTEDSTGAIKKLRQETYKSPFNNV